MAVTIEYKRRTEKKLSSPGVVPTIPPTNDHTDGSWSITDIYEGEIAVNNFDNKVFTRAGNTIIDLTPDPPVIPDPVWQETTLPYGISLTPINESKEVFLASSGAETTRVIVENTNITENSAGAVFVAKASSNLIDDTVKLGVYSPAFSTTPWAGNSVLSTDRNLVISSFGVGEIRFEVGGGSGNPTTRLRLTSDGVMNYEADITPHLVATSLVPKSYVDGLVDTTMKAPDDHDASSGQFPTDYKGSGSVGEGDTFYITTGGTMGTTVTNVGDMLVARVDDPGQVETNWFVLESNRDQATETQLGVSRIATQVLTDGGANDTDYLTPLKLATYSKWSDYYTSTEVDGLIGAIPQYWDIGAAVYGNRLFPTAGNSVKEIYLEDNTYGLTEWLIKNTNDVDNYVGSVIALKGSGPDFTNTVFIGKYGASYYVPEWAGNGVIGTDRELYITAANTTAGVTFQTGGTLAAPVTVARIAQSGVISSLVSGYESLVVANNDIPNKKYVDDLVSSIVTQSDAVQVLASSSTILFDVSNGINAIIELDTDVEIIMSSLEEGVKGKIILIQRDLDNKVTISPEPFVSNTGEGAIDIQNGFGKITIVSYFYDGEALYVDVDKDYSPKPLASELNTVAENGSIIPLFSTVSEAAYYDETLNLTVFAWEGYSNGIKYVYVSTYNHTTRIFSPIVDVGMPTLINDYHGVPCIVKDHEGYIHVFGGSHGNDLQHCVSASPNDFSSFTLQTPISGSFSYPNAVLVGSSIHIIVRNDDTPGYYGLSVISSSSLSAGAASWGAVVELVNLNPTPSTVTTRVYSGIAKVVGQEIWNIFCRYDSSDGHRRDVYFIKYDTSTGSVSNFRDSYSTPSASLPVLRTDADTEYRIYTNGEEGTDVPVWGVDYLNRVNLFFSDGNTTDGFDIYHIYDTGTAWTTPVKVATTYQQYDTFAPIFKARGEIMLVYTTKFTADEGVTYFPYDGNPVYRIRDINGFWSSEFPLVIGVDFPMGRFLPIHNAHPNAKLIFAELSDALTDAYAGHKKLFIYGDNGFLARHIEPNNISVPVVNGVVAQDEILIGHRGIWEGYPNPTLSYQWYSDGSPIVNETDKAIIVTPALVGTTITLGVTGTNKFGEDFSSSSGIDGSTWFSLTDIPGNVVYNGVPSFAYDGSRYIYSGSNNGTNSFWRYDTFTNTWFQLEDSPEEFLDYAFLVYTGSHIYVSKGAYSDVFMRYTIATNTWEYMTSATWTLRTGQHGVWDGGNIIYVQQGDTATVATYRIAEDDWTFVNVAPETLWRGYLAYDGSDNLYVLRGNNTATFYRYNISGDTWTQMTDCLQIAGQGCCMILLGDYIYAVPGVNSNSLLRYNILTNDWTDLSDAPSEINYGGAMASDGTFLYIRKGGGPLDFWRYRI